MSHQMIAFILGMAPIIGLAAAYTWWGLLKPARQQQREDGQQ